MTERSPAAADTLVLGATNPLGLALVRQLVSEQKTGIIAAERPSELVHLKELVMSLRAQGVKLTPATIDPGRPNLGLTPALLARIQTEVQRIFHLAHIRDRSTATAEVQNWNDALTSGVLDLARSAEQLRSMVVLSDVGLTGDYPGRFYEGWVDVGQVPFDEIDRSSIKLERACQKENTLPIIRVRVGLECDTDKGLPPSPWEGRMVRQLIPWRSLVKHLPSFLGIPTAVSEGCLAPLTPISWASRVVSELSQNPDAAGSAYHLTLDAAPPMEELLATLSTFVGGARINGKLPLSIISAFGVLPGISEETRRHRDHLGAWLTPHRYCLSRNELDSSRVKSLLGPSRKSPVWEKIKDVFFNQSG